MKAGYARVKGIQDIVNRLISSQLLDVAASNPELIMFTILNVRI